MLILIFYLLEVGVGGGPGGVGGGNFLLHGDSHKKVHHKLFLKNAFLELYKRTFKYNISD